MSEDEARNSYPLAFDVVLRKVKPEREQVNREAHRRKWWQYGEVRPGLVQAIAYLDKVLVTSCQAYVHLAFAFQPKNRVFAHSLAVLSISTFSGLCCVQSRIHEIWARFFSGTAMDLPRYNHSDCFQTFPFPDNWETNSTLEAVGKTYYEYRAALMIRNNQGLTDTYNRFHDPQETNPEILHLRELHHQMDRAVLTTYGWDTLDTPCGFALDYLDLDETKLPPEAQTRLTSGDLHFSTTDEAIAFDNLIQSTLKTRKKLPWRYRWSPDIHDEILARLLDLNQQRYDAEIAAGPKAKKPTKGKATAKKSSSKTPKATKQLDLIPPETEQLDLL